MIKQPLTHLFSSLALTSLLFADEPVLIPEAKGVILTGDVHMPALHVEGVAVVDLELPGSREALEERLIPLFMEKPLTAEDITEIKREIIRFYRDYNRSIIAVQIPEQDVTDGVLKFLVTEGRVGEITVENNHYFSTKLIRNYIKLQPGELIDDAVLLNDLAFINRNPFRHADLVYSPGKQAGTTNLEVYVKDHFPVRVYVGSDNTGLKATDRTRLYTGFNWGKVLGLDSIMSFQYTTAPNTHKFKGYTLSLTNLLPWENVLLVFGGYSETHVCLENKKNPSLAPKNNPDETATSVNKGVAKTDGKTAQASLRYGIPIKPKPYLLHEFNIGYDFKYTNNSYDFQEEEPKMGENVNLTQFVFQYNFGYQKGIQKAGLDIQLFVSPFTWIPLQSKNAFHSLSPYAKTHYAYVQLATDYAVQLPYNFSLKLFLETQISSAPLLPSEQFGLGGYDTVRGYNERQVNSDEGILFSTELWSPTFSPSFGLLNDGLQMLLFFDYGLGHDIKKIYKIKQTQYLMGIGPGLRYAIGSNLSCRLDFGFKLHHFNPLSKSDKDSGKARKSYIGGIGMANFGIVASY